MKPQVQIRTWEDEGEAAVQNRTRACLALALAYNSQLIILILFLQYFYSQLARSMVQSKGGANHSREKETRGEKRGEHCIVQRNRTSQHHGQQDCKARSYTIGPLSKFREGFGLKDSSDARKMRPFGLSWDGDCGLC